ncbi:MAG: glycoside hydrolase family 65 protein, partial [Firmicutes bacterium]|nr:glycoside hydrolase family 65 protein [Bacillota bacterium]
MQALWDDCDIEIESDDEEMQGALRYNIFMMLCNNAAEDRTVSIGARGLTHGRYKGNLFWDTEIFMLPFYLWTRPQAAKNLLLYRTDRLNVARTLAKKQNLDGARFPWMCSDSGLEQCETWDTGLCEVHITADIAYAAQRYVEATEDEDFLHGPATELFTDTARYWLSRLTYEPAKDKFSSFFVKGPDEYCGTTTNNTFTNYMAQNNIRLALQYGTLNEEDRKRAIFTVERIELLYDAERDLYLQDELLDRLEALPFQKNGDAPSYTQFSYDRMQRYRVLKQADLVLLMNLFPEAFTHALKRNVFDYYEP